MDIKEKLIDYISANIIKTLSFLFLLFGGLIFFIYYIDIRYLPDLNLANIGTILSFASITGIILIISIVLMLVFPAFCWDRAIYQNEIIRNIWTDKARKTIVIIVFPVFVIYSSIFLYLKKDNIWWITLNLLWIISLYLWGANESKKRHLSQKKFLQEYSSFLAYKIFGSFISIIPIIMLIAIFLNDYKEKNLITACIFLISGIMFVNILIIFIPNSETSVYKYPIFGIISFLIIIIFTNKTTLFPRVIMETYQLGNIKASSIVLNKKGCIAINQVMALHQIENAPSNKILQFKIENDSCVIPDVYILSKLGKEFYIEINGVRTENKKKQDISIKFPISSSDVTTYSQITINNK